MQNEDDKILLPHHEQQTLCTTRLPYRQGRKLTAVKVYTVTKESNHLLIFGVPSLNLRQELKSLFIKFGKLLQFVISTRHVSETFTETYHAQYEKIQSAKIAKRMLDTKNFYGGVLHVCYAPELETVLEVKEKLIQRQKDVLFRLRNLQKDTIDKITTEVEVKTKTEPVKLNMGEVNTLILGDNARKRKKKTKKSEKDKTNITVQPNSICESSTINTANLKTRVIENEGNTDIMYSNLKFAKKCKPNEEDTNIELEKDISVIDCTQIDCEVVTNINEHLNYNKFGNEDIRKVPPKPVNKICFDISKKF